MNLFRWKFHALVLLICAINIVAFQQCSLRDNSFLDQKPQTSTSPIGAHNGEPYYGKVYGYNDPGQSCSTTGSGAGYSSVIVYQDANTALLNRLNCVDLAVPRVLTAADFHVDPLDGDKLVFGNQTFTAVIQTPAGNTGVWTKVTPSNVDLTNSLSCGNFGSSTIAVDPNRPSDLYASFDCQGIWKSTDYGVTWIGPIGSPDANGAGGIALGSNGAGNPPIIYQGNLRGAVGFWSSLDGGATWVNHNIAPAGGRQDVSVPVVDPNDSRHILVTAQVGNAIYETLDGGATWRSVPLDSKGGMNQASGMAFIFFINTGNAATTRGTWLWIAGMSGGIYGTWRTSDAGGTWTQVDKNEHGVGNSQIYQPDTSGTIYMAGVYSDLGWGVLKSADFGQTWSHLGIVTNAAVVFGSKGNIFSMWSLAHGLNQTDPTLFQFGPASLWTASTSPSGIAATPSDMIEGAAHVATTVDPSGHTVFVSANWWAGLWRYIEP